MIVVSMVLNFFNFLLGVFTANNNGLTRIGLSSLNATSLLHVAKSMPHYEILDGPSVGKIVKITVPEENNATTGKFHRMLDINK